MTPEEYKRLIKEAMYRAMYGGFPAREERCINPEFKPTPKPEPPQKVKIHHGITDGGQTVHVVRRQVLLHTSTPLADDRGRMILFTSSREAERAAYVCRKMVLLFDKTG